MRDGHMPEVRGDRPGTEVQSRVRLEAHLERARQLRAEAVGAMLASAYEHIAGKLDAFGQALGRWRRQRQSYHALLALSDRMLADIGIAREEVALVARGASTRAAITGWRAPCGAGGPICAHLEAARRARRERRRVHRELMAYSDRELDEIGVRRRAIGAIASGRTVAPAGEGEPWPQPA